TNFLFALPEDVSNAIQSGGPAPSDLSDLERRALDKLKGFFAKNASYAFEMATRPQTLYGLADSPVSLAAWLIDHGDGDDQPAAVTAFPGEVYQPSRRWAERGYSKLSYLHEVDEGGHCGACEEPLLFASEMRAAFKSLN